MNKVTKNNKGFSLVELIIVIAIMAVLIAILAPAFIRYVEDSRQKADITTVDGVISSVQASYTDGSVDLPAASNAAFTVTLNKGSAADWQDLEDCAKENGIESATLKSGKWGWVKISFWQPADSSAVKYEISNEHNSTISMATEYKK